MNAALIVILLALGGCVGHYDCGMAEISPDMPTPVKEACRAAQRHP